MNVRVVVDGNSETQLLYLVIIYTGSDVQGHREMQPILDGIQIETHTGNLQSQSPNFVVSGTQPDENQ